MKDSEFLVRDCICRYTEYKRYGTERLPRMNQVFHTELANDYQKLALRTEAPGRDNKDRLTEGLMGLAGEAGEAIDILKKHLYQGHELDRKHLAEELGDVAWYLAVSADALGIQLSDIFDGNIQKLMNRYPEGFDTRRSVNRKDCMNCIHHSCPPDMEPCKTCGIAMLHFEKIEGYSDNGSLAPAT